MLRMMLLIERILRMLFSRLFASCCDFTRCPYDMLNQVNFLVEHVGDSRPQMRAIYYIRQVLQTYGHQ